MTKRKLTHVTILARVADSDVLNEVCTIEVELEIKELDEPNYAGATKMALVDIAGVLEQAVEYLRAGGI